MSTTERLKIFSNQRSSSEVISHLFSTYTDIRVRKAYFFCRYNQDSSLRADTIVRSLLRQCLEVDTLNDGIASKLGQILSQTAAAAQDISSVLRTILPVSLAHFIVVDGLDDCFPPERNAVLDILSGLLKTTSTPLKILISSRDAMPELFREKCHEQQTISQSQDAFNADVTAFIDTSLATRLEHDPRMIGDLNLILEVREALLSGADGM